MSLEISRNLCWLSSCC